MVAGRLQEKKDYFYIVLSYTDKNGKRHQPWFKTGLRVRGNKKKAEALLKKYRENFDVETGLLAQDWDSRNQDEVVDIIITKSDSEQIESSATKSKKSVADEILFGDYMLQWLEKNKNTIELTTYSGYKRNITSVIAPYFNKRGITLGGLSGEIIDEFYNSELERGLSPNTVIRYHANIRTALEEAFKDNLISCNFADKAHRPKEEEYVAEYYNRDELLELFDIVKGKKIEFAVIMAAYYGLRREEIIGLKWSCIDFNEKTIKIKHTVTECSIDGKFTMVAKDRGKSKKSIRTLPLVPPVEKILLRMKAKEELNKEMFGDTYDYQHDEYIYKDIDGKLVKPCFVSQHFAECVIKKNKLKKIRFHDLRHSCATLLRREGVPMEDIQKWLGHSQITITNKLYAHFEYGAHLKSAEKIGKALEM